jgi:hypothetical protein
LPGPGDTAAWSTLADQVFELLPEEVCLTVDGTTPSVFRFRRRPGRLTEDQYTLAAPTVAHLPTRPVLVTFAGIYMGGIHVQAVRPVQGEDRHADRALARRTATQALDRAWHRQEWDGLRHLLQLHQVAMLLRGSVSRLERPADTRVHLVPHVDDLHPEAASVAAGLLAAGWSGSAADLLAAAEAVTTAPAEVT